MKFFINVIVPLALADSFTYEVNENEFHYLKIGMRVAVPFGKSKVYTALVIQKHNNPPLTYEAKEIQEIIDSQPIVNEKQIAHWQWLAEYYMCSLGEVYRNAVPSALLLESETIVVYKPKNEVLISDLSDDEFLLYEAFQSQAVLKIEEIISILNKKNIFPIIQSLLQKEIIVLNEEMIETYKPKLIKYVRLHSDFDAPEKLKDLLEMLSRSEKQRTLVMKFFQMKTLDKKPIPVKTLLEEADVSNTVLKGLVTKDIFVEYTLAEDRVVFNEVENQEITLSDFQQIAFDQINESFEKFDVTLLKGITGSGKTEIYIRLIEQFLKQEKQVLYLLPEIALTTQLVQRLTKHFGNQVAVFHSKYSSNERVEVWHRVNQNSEKAKIVIGARSSVFLPFSNLGFIVVDEEHEPSFKQQDPAPRFHARDAAIVLAKMHDAKVLLGSATPSLESYYNAYQNKFGLVTLEKRFGNVKLPEIVLVDLKEKQKRKEMKGHFSIDLLDEINETLSRGEQVILFQNRRGYSPVLECLTCGHVPQCPSCDVSLTYHKYQEHLRCHYCGYTMAKPLKCHVCHSVDITTKGFGTEQIEIELKELFLNRNIARMDQDTMRGKYAFEKLIDSFKNLEIDILVGTQMLAKGLDFDNVTLVGILNADNALHFPDFRAHERAFQMFLQVAGRAGRKDKEGKVMMQTYNPYHNIIQQVTTNDYATMFKEQMYERLNFKYPPFYRLIRLQLKHVDYQKLKEGSFWLYNYLSNQLEMPVLGPEEPSINRIRNQYIRIILIKIPINVPLNKTKNDIRKSIKSFEAIGAYRSIKTIISVDFY
ncbi:primosomal protein N' [Flavobacterium sp. I3-2]|uniref:replication restart helicase PriA n=1 Tax=Flavobacterium sp. I3-2 TaxID=2748319 RepID=UPI0015AACBAA|nr:primosomal protein N' [Flavobacterium sp. I3-2]